MEIKLTVNGIELNVGVELTTNIASYINDNEVNQEIFHQLAQHSSSAIRKEIAYKDNISTETAELLLKDKDSTVLMNILRNQVTKELFTDDDFEYFLSFNNEELISDMIGYLDDYENLSDLNSCYAKIIDLENNYLTLQIANNYNTPKKILKKLLKHNDPDIVIAAKNSLD
jgi:hypothetical protein